MTWRKWSGSKSWKREGVKLDDLSTKRGGRGLFNVCWKCWGAPWLWWHLRMLSRSARPRCLGLDLLGLSLVIVAEAEAPVGTFPSPRTRCVKAVSDLIASVLARFLFSFFFFCFLPSRSALLIFFLLALWSWPPRTRRWCCYRCWSWPR